jgi:hypothetical protein
MSLSAGKIIALIAFVFFAVLFVYNLNDLIRILDSKAQQESDDKLYLSHGCYINDSGDKYICPNGLPPGK